MSSSASYECSLHGQIPDKLKPKLIERLIGLTGGEDFQSEIYEHEIGFIPTVETPIGPARNEDVMLKLRASISENVDLLKRNWQLCLYGHPEPRTGRNVTVRPMIYVNMKGDAFKYMSNLGYTFGFEYVRKGHAFVYKDLFRITVTQIFKFETPQDLSTLHLLDPTNTWLVEVSSISIIQEAVSKTVEEINNFKALFTGIVDLGYVDHLYLLNKVTYRS